ncbi:MAG: hypothetical protein HYV67_04535 [Candidatus Taylorbacteria bacterium]|nr:hypothetical protein [Candidatus Taylorbacteria bacterium]
MNKKEVATQLILRLGVAFAFIYAAIAGFIDPQSWVGWFPKFMRDMVPELLLLQIWGVFEIILGLWILSGKKIFIPSVLASLSLAGLILTNLAAMDIIFRDVTIFAAALALAVQSYPEKTAV